MHKAAFSLLTLPLMAAAAVGAGLFVKRDGAPAGPADNAFGVTVSGADAGAMVSVDVLGVALVQAAEALEPGDPVASNAQGQAVKAAGAAIVRGTAVHATGVGELADVLLIPSAKAAA